MLKLAALVLGAALLIGGMALFATSFEPPKEQPCAAYQHERGSEAFKNCIEADSAQRVAIFTEQLAEYTGGLTLLTLVLAIVSGWQGWMTRQSISLARAEFNATQRPKIKVLGIELSEDTTRKTDENGDEILTQQVWAKVRFVNKGTATATIIEVANILLTEEPTVGAMIPFQVTDGKRYNLRVGEPGSNDSRRISSTETFGAFFNDPIYCVGYIDYLDAAGTWRKTGWCWKSIDGPHVWERVKGSPFDYSY